MGGRVSQVRGRVIRTVAMLHALAFAPGAMAAGDAMLCYKTRTAKGAVPFSGASVTVRDETTVRSLDLTRPRTVCVPADVGAGIIEPAVALRAYKARAARHEAPYASDAAVQLGGPFGEHWVSRKAKPSLLLLPATIDGASPPTPPDPNGHGRDAYRCHRARDAAVGGSLVAGQEVVVSDALTATRRFGIRKVSRLCDPVGIDEAVAKDAATSLACYALARISGEPRHEPAMGLDVATAIEATTIDTAKELELCVPVRAIARCNGHAALCGRSFDAVSYPTTHNAMSNAEEGWLGPNQSFGITRQLDDGIRALMLDTWYFGGEVVLCHGGDVFPCDVTGMKPLADGLAEIVAFLERRPSEVVSIIFESYVAEADVEAAVIASGLAPYVHVQAGGAWPTLREMVATDARLVVFTDDASAVLPWHHYVWSHAWETHFSAETPEDFSCAKNRGSLANPLFILNHFLTAPIGFPHLAEMVNHDPFFVERALQCQAESGALPNFVTVDFYDIGDVFHVVDVLNGLGS